MTVVRQLILHSLYRANILPVTSACNVQCIFCSHRQNPPGVEVFRIPPLTATDAVELLDFIDNGKKIIIGESVTRIIEGEPFTNPDLFRILTLIRERFPDVPVQITTNGTLLDESKVAALARLKPVEINLSLNTSSAVERQRLMGAGAHATAIESARLLAAYKVTFHGSIVAMPHVTGWEDLGQTVGYLADAGAITVRVFMPGYTRLAPDDLRFDPGLGPKLEAYISAIRKTTAVPVTFEPRRLSGLQAEVEGVIGGSPADAAGVRNGDVITAVDGQSCFSRVDAFRRAFQNSNPELNIFRLGKFIKVKLSKKKQSSSGLVLSYDLDPDVAKEIPRIIRRHRAPKTLLLTSVLAAEVLRAGLAAIDCPGDTRVLEVPSLYFGGSIAAAGLLTVSDFMSALDQYLTQTQNSLPDLVILPAAAFDDRGRDLTGIFCTEIEDKYRLQVALN